MQFSPLVAATAFIHRPKLLFGEQVHLFRFPACTVPRISSSDFVDGWRTKTLGHGSLLDFKCFRLFIAKRAGVLGWIGPGFSCSSPEYRGHSGGPVDISILGRGGWNLEAEEHLALLPWMCTFLGVLWLPGSVLNGYKSIVILRVNHWRGIVMCVHCCTCVVSLSCQLLERPCQVTTMGVTRLLERTHFNFAFQHRLQQQYTSQVVKLAQPDII